MWVDIEKASVHTLTGDKHETRTFPETRYVPAVAGVAGAEDGLVAAFHDRLVHLPSPSSSSSPEDIAILIPEEEKSAVRLNDGACDPAGRFLVGSMNLDGLGISPPLGKLYSVSPSSSGGYQVKTLLEDVGCSNGIDWTPDGRTMYYIDSAHPRIDVFDYDASSGCISNRRVFVTEADLPPLPPASRVPAPMVAFDGLTVDGAGNVWVARWGESRVVCYRPSGEAILQVVTPEARTPTIPAFGGEGLDELWLATASAELAGQKAQDWPRSGDVFKLKIGQEIKALLGGGWKGRARHGFRLA